MYEYRFAHSHEWLKVIDFIDLVFSQAARPHDFAALIPKVYGDKHNYSHIHAVALEDGEIRGCVAVLPFDMSIAGHPLRVGYVGSVSVHRLSRGAGHMKELMRMQIEKAKAEGIDMMVLGGQRQRYGYFGFSPVGGVYCYTVTHANVRHALKDVDASGFTFTALENAADSEYAFSLYQQQLVCGSRTPESFAEIACSFNCRGWLIKQNDQNIGYLIADKSHTELPELVVEDDSLIPAVLKAWMAEHAIRHLNVFASPSNKPLNRTLAAFAEEYTIGQDGYVLCLNYANTIRSWMRLKNSISSLAEGCIRLGIGNDVLNIKVENGVVTVDSTSEPAQISLSAAEADQLLFGFNRFYAPEIPGLPTDWFPLPLAIPRADTF